MTNEQAIAHFKEQLEIFGGEHHEAMKVAIEALEKQIPKKDSCADYHDVIGQLQEYIRESNNIDYNRALVEAIEVIRKRTCVKDCWIPCCERLPAEGDEFYPMCLVTLDNGDVCLGVYRHDDKVWYTRMSEGETVYVTIHKVLAWRPLPEPYKDGE